MRPPIRTLTNRPELVNRPVGGATGRSYLELLQAGTGADHTASRPVGPEPRADQPPHYETIVHGQVEARISYLFCCHDYLQYTYIIHNVCLSVAWF